VLSDVYSLVLAFPLAVTVIKVMLNPFGQGFKVTPKGGVSDRFSFNWQLALPLIAMFMVTALSLWLNLGNYLVMGIWRPAMPLTVIEELKGIGLGWVWSAYNLLMLSIALLTLIDVPRHSSYEWYDLRRTVQLQVDSPVDSGQQIGCDRQPIWGISTAISEMGVEVSVNRSLAHIEEMEMLPVQIEFLEESLVMQGQIRQVDTRGEFPVVQVLFDSLDLNQQRQLIKLLYCRPGQWKSRCSPGEFQSLWILLKILLKPRFLFDRKAETVALSK
jgi:cellulose synthase (UDP-forming)